MLWVPAALGVLSLLCLAAFWCRLEPTPIPEPLKVLRFSPGENSYLRGIQEEEDFALWCECPGCGKFAMHEFSAETDGVPKWSWVIRKCSYCYREWAQH